MNPDQIENPEVFKDLERRFDANPYLAAFDAKKRKVALKGEKTPFIQDEVLDEIGADRDQFRMLYRFFSEHTHTGPLSFYRMEDHDRGTGVETRHEKRYMLMVIQFAAGFLARAVEIQLAIVPDAETRKANQTVQQIRASVERNQGRLREKRSRGASRSR